jgi:hypothetical protein
VADAGDDTKQLAASAKPSGRHSSSTSGSATSFAATKLRPRVDELKQATPWEVWMPPIEGNFKPKLEILWGGRGVAARGPLEWDDKAKSMTLHVAIMKGDVAATGRTGDDVPKPANEFLVAAAVQGNGKFTPGPAIATGLALVHGDGVEMYQWSVGVELVNGAPTGTGKKPAAGK